MSALHYWTGRGTLCSLSNSTRQQPNHTTHWPAVTCKYCLFTREQNQKGRQPESKQ